MLGEHGCNIVLMKVDNDEATVSKAKKMAQEYGLVVTDYDKTRDTNLAFTLVSTSAIFFNPLAAFNLRQFKDYTMLRAIEAENHNILRLLLLEASLTPVT